MRPTTGLSPLCDAMYRSPMSDDDHDHGSNLDVLINLKCVNISLSSSLLSERTDADTEQSLEVINIVKDYGSFQYKRIQQKRRKKICKNWKILQ